MIRENILTVSHDPAQKEVRCQKESASLGVETLLQLGDDQSQGKTKLQYEKTPK
jgi:hypothetical protein